MMFEIHALMQNAHDQNTCRVGGVKYDMRLMFISS